DFLLSLFNAGSNRYGLGDMGDGISPDALRAYLRDSLGLYGERPGAADENTVISLIEDYVASEDVLAGYLMATVDFDSLRVIAGARVEHTRFDAKGFSAEFDEDGDLAIAAATADSSYTDVLPGLHLRYDTEGDWVFRGAL